MEESLGTRLLRQIKEVCEIAGIKTEEYARISRKRIDVLSLDREIAKEKGSLGDRVYALAEREDPGEVLADVTVQAVLTRIRNLEASLGECAEEIATLRESARARATEIRRKYETERSASWSPEGATSSPETAASGSAPAGAREGTALESPPPAAPPARAAEKAPDGEAIP